MPNVITIDDPADPRIAAYRDVRERDLVGREGHFIAEGEVVLRVLIEGSRHRPASLLIADKRMAKLQPLLAKLPAEVPVYRAPQEVLDGIIGFHLHRGILALGRQAPMPGADQLLAQTGRDAVVLVLLGIANHDNVGGLFRNAAAFGVDGVILDQTSCDPLYRKAIRVSVGASLIVPFARLSPDDDLFTLFGRHGFDAVALSPQGQTPLHALGRGPRTAVLLGAEGPGLSAEVLAAARTVAIPMADGFDSLNVATTSGIVLHHLRFVAPPV